MVFNGIIAIPIYTVLLYCVIHQHPLLVYTCIDLYSMSLSQFMSVHFLQSLYYTSNFIFTHCKQ